MLKYHLQPWQFPHHWLQANGEDFSVRSPKQTFSRLFIDGVAEGFCIGFKQQSESLQSAKWNLICALQNPDTVKSYLTEEVSAGHVAGPFSRSSVPHALSASLGVIPKKPQPIINGS